MTDMPTFIGNATDDANNPQVGEAGGNDVDTSRGDLQNDVDAPTEQDATEVTDAALTKDDEEDESSASDNELTEDQKLLFDDESTYELSNDDNVSLDGSLVTASSAGSNFKTDKCGFCSEDIFGDNLHPYLRKCSCCKNTVKIHESCIPALMKKEFFVGQEENYNHNKMSPKKFNELDFRWYCSLCEQDCFYCNIHHEGTYIIIHIKLLYAMNCNEYLTYSQCV